MILLRKVTIEVKKVTSKENEDALILYVGWEYTKEKDLTFS